ncbi:MAG: glycosyltransferase [bacterium]
MNNKKVNYTSFLNEKEKAVRSIYISSYIPRKCGIATFTKDLTNAINHQNPEAIAEIIALNDNGENYDYPWEVKYRISQNNPEDYISACNYINQSSADIVNLQHEFGLFGGVDGDYILPMIDMLEKKLVSCFHSILQEPDEHKKYIIKRIIEKSEAVIAMSENSRQILINVYDCPEEKAVLIYHGVPDFTFEDTIKYKERLNIETERMLLMSGLLGPGKGIEYVINSMPKIIEIFPNTKFYIVGQTHPSLLRSEKEAYREKLQEIIEELNLSNNIIFINKYLTLEELKDYYLAADIFLTPHLDPQQPTSGTLAYALGAGKICISTPYNYAKEMLANGTGIIVQFKNSDDISKSVIEVFSDNALYNKYRNSSFQLGKQMQWPRVARRNLNLFRFISEN